MITYNPELKGAVNTAIATAFSTGADLEVWSGIPPHVSDGTTGTLLAVMSLPPGCLTVDGDGELVGVGPWMGVVSQTGTPGYFRLYGDGGYIQGTVGTTAASDMMVESSPLNRNNVFFISGIGGRPS